MGTGVPKVFFKVICWPTFPRVQIMQYITVIFHTEYHLSKEIIMIFFRFLRSSYKCYTFLGDKRNIFGLFGFKNETFWKIFWYDYHKNFFLCHWAITGPCKITQLISTKLFGNLSWPNLTFRHPSPNLAPFPLT